MNRWNLERFKTAQDLVFHRVVAELEAGRKQSHWMWYIFPQIAGLGHSSTARRFAIVSLNEAKAYWQDPLLRGRLALCCQLLLKIRDKSASEIFGYPDDIKLRSSMTLFAGINPVNSIFHQVLERFFDGQPDPLTLKLLEQWVEG
jgi:uncharacterized protein (DUF1810 family)